VDNGIHVVVETSIPHSLLLLFIVGHKTFLYVVRPVEWIR